MGLRGENIGTAYIRILADGSGLDRSVRDQMDDIDWDKNGRAASAEWREGWIEDASRNANQKSLRESISKPLARGEWLSTEFFRSKNWTSFRSGLRKEFGDAGERAGEDFERRLLEGMDFDRLGAELDNLTPLLKKKQQEISKELADADLKDRQDRDRDLERHWADLTEKWTALWDEAHDENRRRDLLAHKERLDLDKEWELHIADLARQDVARQEQLARLRQKERDDIALAYRMNDQYDRQRNRNIATFRENLSLLTRETEQLAQGLRNAMPKGELSDLVRRMNEDVGRLNITNKVWLETLRDTDRTLVELNPRMRRTSRSLQTVADMMGRAFGRGSRNDFVNFIGVVTRGLASIPALAVRAMDSLMTSAARGTLLKDMGKAVAGIGGMTAAVGAFMSGISSVLSLAAGAVVALASSLSFALVGALGAVAGAFAPVIAGIGVMVAAFKNAPPEAERALKSIKKSFSGLGDVAGESVFGNITEQAERFKGVIGDLSPLVRNIGEAISRVGDHWLDLLENRGFRQFRSAMEDFLPDAVESFGRTLGNALSGAGGLLRSLIPLTQDFLRWMEKGTENWAKWINSKDGQDRMLSFWQRTKESLVSVGDFLGATKDLLAEILSAGKDAGDNLFGNMADKFREWTAALQENPQILSDWFNAAEDFGRAIGRVVTGLGQLVGALDNTISRQVVTSIFDTLAAALRGISGALEGVSSLFGGAESAVTQFAAQAAAAAVILPRLTGAMTRVQTGVTGMVANLKNAETRMKTMAGVAKGAAGVGGLMAISAGAQTSNKWLGILSSTAGGAMMGAFGGPWGAVIGGAAGLVMGLGSAFASSSDEAADAAPKLAGWADTMDTVTGATTRATRALALQKLSQTDAIDRARQFGISSRDMVSAVLGEEGALRRVNKALNSKKDLLGGLTGKGLIKELQALGIEFEDEAKAVRTANEAITSWKEALRGLPKKVATEVKAIGMDATKAEVADLAKKYKLTPKEIRTVIDAVGMDATVKDIKELIKKMDETDGKKANPKVDLDKKGFDAKNRAALGDIEKLAGKKPTPKTDLNLSGFNGKNATMLKLIQDLTGKKPTPKADLDPKQFNAKNTDLLGKIRTLDDKKPKPTVDIHDLLTKPMANLVGKLNDLGNMVKKPTVGINDQASGAIQNIKSMISSITGKTVTITTHYAATGSGKIPRTATGGMFSMPQVRLIGEAGPEAVVPLNRPLDQVDPAVRWLSAIAQGKPPAMARGGVVGAGKTIDVGGITVVTPNSDARAVASEVVNRLVAVGY